MKDESFYVVKMTRDEMIQVLRLWFHKENADLDELEQYARNTGGLPYELIECCKIADKKYCNITEEEKK